MAEVAPNMLPTLSLPSNYVSDNCFFNRLRDIEHIVSGISHPPPPNVGCMAPVPDRYHPVRSRAPCRPGAQCSLGPVQAHCPLRRQSTQDPCPGLPLHRCAPRWGARCRRPRTPGSRTAPQRATVGGRGRRMETKGQCKVAAEDCTFADARRVAMSGQESSTREEVVPVVLETDCGKWGAGCGRCSAAMSRWCQLV